MCIDKRVVIGLAGVAIGILVVAPRALGAALPLLIVLICPLSMLFMMRGMSRGQSCAAGDSQAASGDGRQASSPSDADEAELIQLRAEVDQLRADIRDREAAQTVQHEHDGPRS